MDRKFRVAILTGGDNAVTCMSIAPLLSIPEVEVSAILFDSDTQTLRRRYRNLKRNIKREGWTYLLHRASGAIRGRLDDWASSITPHDEVRSLLRKAFPEKFRSLDDLSQTSGIPLKKVGNLNSPEAASELGRLNVDLGIVLGTRVLKRSTFSVPRLGSINLHKGEVPQFRGMPPGFWELYDGASTAGTTVHFVDDSLDTGDIVGESSLEVHRNDTPTTLRRKLDISGTELLTKVVREIASGEITRKKQVGLDLKPRTSPTREEWIRLHKRRGLRLPDQGMGRAFKTFVYLGLFHSRIWHLVRALRIRSRGAILLYHRVNDLCDDCLTASCERFAEHLVLLRRYYCVLSSAELVKRVSLGTRLPDHTVAIHFDDCYRDVYTNAARLLHAASVPACAFVSSGFVDTQKKFAHDESKYPIPLENLTTSDLRGLRQLNLEIGSHTVSHPNLASCTPEQAHYEVTQSKKDLERLTGNPVLLFSYPYGKLLDVGSDTARIVEEAGYVAMFSAHGGYVGRETSLFDLPRFGIDDSFRGLEFLMEIEGLSFGQLKRKLQRNGTKSQARVEPVNCPPMAA